MKAAHVFRCVDTGSAEEYSVNSVLSLVSVRVARLCNTEPSLLQRSAACPIQHDALTPK